MEQESIVQKSHITDVAPCLAHPCDSPGGGFACRNCAFSRTEAVHSVDQKGKGNVIISAQEYNCRLGGVIYQDGNQLFMKVGNSLYPEKSDGNKYVTDAQKRLKTYVQLVHQ